MPIVVKDYTWTQSESRICINLPLKGTKSSNIDVLNSLDFVKLSYPPFLFECWFYDKVKDEKCTAVTNNGIISVQFSKEEEKVWPNLFHPDFENKELLKKVREDAIVFAGERAKRLAEQKIEDAAKNKKIALKEQMKIEEEERNRISQIKEKEKLKASEEIEKFKEIHKANTKEVALMKPIGNGVKIEKSTDANKEIFDFKEIIEAPKKIEKEIPLPRSSGSIQVKFTPRIFPTPSRESQDKLEKEWLENQAEARRLTELPDDMKDLTPDEKNLDYLKQKAGNLYKQENYQSAIGVYNHAVRIFPKVPALYSNRAACHYKVRNLFKCIEDCTRALDLLTPPVEDNAQSRLKAHVRRGTAFCELELYAEGLLDYEAALKIEPDNAEIQNDAENIRKIILGSPPEDIN